MVVFVAVVVEDRGRDGIRDVGFAPARAVFAELGVLITDDVGRSASPKLKLLGCWGRGSSGIGGVGERAPPRDRDPERERERDG